MLVGVGKWTGLGDAGDKTLNSLRRCGSSGGSELMWRRWSYALLRWGWVRQFGSGADGCSCSGFVGWASIFGVRSIEGSHGADSVAV